MNKHTKTQIWT